jgi:Ca2+-binding EF-hand superfamily protein
MTTVIKKKSNTVAERVAWFERSSDIHGSHLRTDLDSYLTLIRRKIQEKCATTIELINHIRRYRIGESGAVTPNEFRFTLIKFGVILPQTLVDRVFNVFDSDRSGTMDFDEFAMWIMNSEFRPAIKTAPASMESPQDILRRKLKVVVDANRRTFLNMPKELSYLQYIADVSRMQYAWSENEGRAIFQTLDPKDSGFIQSQALLNWADNGIIQTEAEKQKPPEIVARSLGELISKVVGRNSKQLETAFSHIKHGEGIKITFDEFRRCLLNAGVGKNIHDCQQVFNALGGNISGFADVDLFFNTLSPIMVDPSTEVSAKPAPTANALASRADRLLREKMRKCFKVVSSDIENSDQSNCGYIDADSLFKILVKRCMPLTFQDFRFVIQQVHSIPMKLIYLYRSSLASAYIYIYIYAILYAYCMIYDNDLM